MGLVLQVLMIVALLFFDSHQLRTRGASTSFLGQRVSRAASPWGNGFSTGMGPYEIAVEIFRQCDDRGVNLAKLNLEAYNTKTATGSKILYRGNFTTPFTKEEFQRLRLRAQVFRQKDQKEFQMLKYEENMCLAFGIDGPGNDVFIAVKKVFGVDVGVQCYIPTGSYSFNDWDIKIELPPPILEYGHYKTIIELIHDHQVFVCLHVLSEVKQKDYF